MGNLGTVLEKLSSLFSRYFLIGSYFPVLIFLSANGACLYAISPDFRKWLGMDIVQQGIAGVMVLVAAAVLAYLFSTLSVTLRQWLEEPPMLTRSCLSSLIAESKQDRNKLHDELSNLMRQKREFKKRRDEWNQRLVNARKQGLTKDNNYSRQNELGAVLSRRGELLSQDEIEKAVEALVAALNVNDAGKNKALDQDEVDLREIIDQFPGLLNGMAASIFNDIQFNFAKTGTVAPTRMGNIALSVQSYYNSRYNLNFNFFWTRIQKTLGGDDKFFPVIEAAHAQLEFHVLLFWLSCIFGLIWIPGAAWYGFSVVLLMAVLIGVPLAAWISYELAVQSYRSYADLLRTTVDLYHFKLSESLHLALPPSSNNEREMWKEVGRWLDQGDYIDISYKHS